MEYDTFLDALAARITTIPGVQAVARAGSGELQLTLAGDATARINPRNAWRAVQAGETLDHVLAVQADVIATTIARQGQIGTWQDAAPRIVTRPSGRIWPASTSASPVRGSCRSCGKSSSRMPRRT
jgi:hypothetical protein